MNVVKTYIAPSKIEGLGMFAGEFIPKGALIWRLDGTDIIISEKEIYDLKLNINQYNHVMKYSFKYKDNYIFCTDDQKYCNHSNIPNTICDYKTQVALKDINKGEEITCNYAEFEEGFIDYGNTK